MKSKFILFGGMILLVAVVLVRCRQNGLSGLPTHVTSPGDSVAAPTNPTDSIAIQWFPSQKGDSWTYQVTDTVHHATLPYDIPPGLSDTVQTVMFSDSLITGTLKITVADTTTLKNGSKPTIWQNVWPQDKKFAMVARVGLSSNRFNLGDVLGRQCKAICVYTS